jgi:hypothetical protein
MWDLWWTKWQWDMFFPSTSVFPCKFHSTAFPLKWKSRKNFTIFITGLHNKPQGCGASVASAAGPFNKKKPKVVFFMTELQHTSTRKQQRLE